MKTNGKIFGAIAMAMLAVGVSTGSASAAVLIDDFSESPFSLKLLSNQTSATTEQTGLSTVLGGSRTVVLARNTGLTYKGPARPEVDTGINENDVSVLVLSAPNDFAGKVSLTYGLYDESTFNLVSDTEAFHIDVVGYDAPGAKPMKVSVILKNADGVTETGSIMVSETLVPTTYLVPFTYFSPATLTAADVVSVVFETPTGGDFQVASFSTGLPEPSLMTMLAPGMLLVARRRKQA